MGLFTLSNMNISAVLKPLQCELSCLVKYLFLFGQSTNDKKNIDLIPREDTKSLVYACIE